MYKPTDFQTPTEIAQYMVSLVPKGAVSILEPTPGIGNIVRVLQGNHFKVTAPEDYFSMERSRFDAIVMNPPFSSKYAFNIPDSYSENGMKLGYRILTDCMEMSDTVIALMPWFTISDSDVRMRFIKSWGLKSITALPRKTFQYARIQTAVFELQKGFDGQTLFHYLDARKFSNE